MQGDGQASINYPSSALNSCSRNCICRYGRYDPLHSYSFIRRELQQAKKGPPIVGSYWHVSLDFQVLNILNRMARIHMVYFGRVFIIELHKSITLKCRIMVGMVRINTRAKSSCWNELSRLQECLELRSCSACSRAAICTRKCGRGEGWVRRRSELEPCVQERLIHT